MPGSRPDTPELLAPAGGPESLRAAVANGADAVYLGVGEFNARRGAENFDLAGLGEACEFAHLHGVSVYLTANVLVLPGEMSRIVEVVDEAWAAGVDAVIVQDLGLLATARDVLPHVRLHASTQLNAHSAATVEALAEAGVKRVTLAREMSVPRIAAAVEAGRHTGVEVESFVHGALCVCYSGQCLLSSMVGGRSANRGMCAQPCRLPYELFDGAGGRIETPGAHLLSPKDLAGITVLPRLVASGVSALKIEGRMKSPEYVAAVTGVYRAALDRAAADPDSFAVSDGEFGVLSEAFSRGFSEAYLISERGNDMMSYNRPNNRGVFVGRIVESAGQDATVALERPLDAEDTLEVWTSRGRFAQQSGQMLHQGKPAAFAPAGSRVTLTLEKPAAVGDRVFRVRSASLAAAARRTFSAGSTALEIPLDFTVHAVIGQPLTVSVADTAGRVAEASGAVVEPARTRPVSVADVIEHVGRLGNTPYTARTFDVELSAGAGMGFSALHHVRRDALAAYERAVLAPWGERVAARPRLKGRRPRALPLAAEVVLVAGVDSLEAADAVLAAGADEAHLPVVELTGVPGTPRLVPVLGRVAHDGELERSIDAARGSERVSVATLGALARLRDSGAALDAHAALNVANANAVDELARMGASRVWLSPELTLAQLREVAAGSDVPVGVTVAGRTEVMVTEHCILMTEGECDRGCAGCVRRRRSTHLRDRRGYSFPVVTDSNGVSHLYNSVQLDVTHALGDILAAGVSAVRLDLETLGPEDAAAEVRRVREALRRAQAGQPNERVAETTTGHFFRGVS